MRKNIKNMIILLAVLAALLLFVEISGIGRKSGAMVEIPENAGISEIATVLKENHFIGNSMLFRVYSVLTGRTYFAGSYYLEKAGYKNIAESLSVPQAEQKIGRAHV